MELEQFIFDLFSLETINLNILINIWKFGGIPLEELINYPNFPLKHLTFNQIYFKFLNSNILNNFLFNNTIPIIKSPFLFHKTKCLINNNFFELSQLKIFIINLMGKNDFSIYKKEKIEIKFNSNEDLILFWRSLKYLPFKNQYLHCKPIITYDSKLLSFKEENPSNKINIEKVTPKQFTINNFSNLFITKSLHNTELLLN